MCLLWGGGGEVFFLVNVQQSVNQSKQKQAVLTFTLKWSIYLVCSTCSLVCLINLGPNFKILSTGCSGGSQNMQLLSLHS